MIVNSSSASLAQVIVDRLSKRGVKRMFGVPGGGSSLDIIDAGARAGIDFILARSETAAAFMAAVTAELTGSPGVVITGIGPGAASAVNGIAYAALEKAPVVLISDCHEDETSLHQAFDQQALYRPLVKAGCRLKPENADEFDALIDLALTRPYGPVHIDLSAADARRPAEVDVAAGSQTPVAGRGDMAAARALVAQSRRPVIVAGLDARSPAAAKALLALAQSLAAPVLCTYKAKGVLSDDHPLMVGLFTGARAEAASLDAADLIVLFGFDPVEQIPGRWRYGAPLLELAATPGHRQPVPPAVRLHGALDELVDGLQPALAASEWSREEIAGLKQSMAEDVALPADTLTAEAVTRSVQRAAPAGTRLAVDSGAHMFAAMAFWRAQAPFGVLKSNGLSSMGFALPAAIASVLAAPRGAGRRPHRGRRHDDVPGRAGDRAPGRRQDRVRRPQRCGPVAHRHQAAARPAAVHRRALSCQRLRRHRRRFWLPRLAGRQACRSRRRTGTGFRLRRAGGRRCQDRCRRLCQPA